jgi:hypothetical protein
MPASGLAEDWHAMCVDTHSMSDESHEDGAEDNLPPRLPAWPRWLWITGIVLAFLAMMTFLFISAV